MIKKNVLLLDGDGTQTLPIAKSITMSGYCVHMFYSKKLSYGYPTRFVKVKVKVSLSDLGEDNFKDYLINYLKHNNIIAIIPLSDSSARFLSYYKDELIYYSKFIIPDYSIFNQGYSKGQLMELCEYLEIPHPRTLNEIDTDSIDESIFPAILKPNYTTGGRGMSYIPDKVVLKEKLSDTIKHFGVCHLQEFIAPGGRQFKVQLYLNEKSELQYSSVLHKQRFYPVGGGSSSCSTSIVNDDYVEMCLKVLIHIGWVGFADFDLIEDPRDGSVKIMEINPRVPACIKAAVDSGIDYGVIMLNDILGKPILQYSLKPGFQLRHLGFEVLWMLTTKKILKTKPNWFNFFKKQVTYQDVSFSDILPFIYGTIGNILNQIQSGNRKKSFF